MLLGKELYSKEVLLILFFFFMKETWSHISCQRPGNPYYDKKKVGYFWLPKARKPVTMLAWQQHKTVHEEGIFS